MSVSESSQFTEDYYAADKRAIGNSAQVFFKDGTSTEKVVVEYPIGHRRRREEGIPLLKDKFRDAVANHFTEAQEEKILGLFDDPQRLDEMPVCDFVDSLIPELQ